MAAPTTTTVAAARAQLVTALAVGELAEVDGVPKVHYAWPGPHIAQGAHEMVYVERIRDWTQRIPTIKAGRKQRDEEFTFDLGLWVSQPDTDADGAQQCFERAIELHNEIDNAIADDVQLGLTTLKWSELTDRTVEQFPHQRGWACFIGMSITGRARLV